MRLVLGDQHLDAVVISHGADSDEWQDDAKHASLSRRAVDLDASAMIGDDPVADREAESRAATRGLRREERLEEPLPHRAERFRDPLSITSMISSSPRTGDRNTFSRIVPGLSHRVHRVEHQRHEHLHELIAIGTDEQRGLGGEIDIDVHRLERRDGT